MNRKICSYTTGQIVRNPTGAVGIVITRQSYDKAKAHLREGRKLGHFFSPGCCANPDYILQVPVLFEDNTFDVMKALSLKREDDPPREKVELLRDMAARLEGDAIG